MRWPLIVVLAACGGSNSGASATVIALGGYAPEVGATILSHRDDGTTIDQLTADGTGTATIGTEPGALVSVVFPGVITATTTTISIITTPIPDSGMITIHGPPDPAVEPVVGALEVMAPPLAVDFGYDIVLGCATIAETQFPATVNVSAPCTGSDINLDVLVRGYHFTGEDLPPEVIGYAAARVPLEDEMAEFDIPSWDMGGTDVPVTLTAVTPTVVLDLWVDGLMFPTQQITDHAVIWDGLDVDSSSIIATQGSSPLTQITTIDAPGTPSTIVLGVDDFLPQLESTVTLGDPSKLAIQWTPLSTGDTSDAIDLRVGWQGTAQIVWDAVLPPSADHVTFATDLGGAVMLPTSTAGITSTFREIDSSDLTGFDALQAADLFVTDPVNASTIVPTPGNGEIRTSIVTGFR